MSETLLYAILRVKNPTRCNGVSKFLLFHILNEAQHVSGDTPPVIRSLELHMQPLVLHTWNVVGRAVVGRCRVAYAKGTGKAIPLQAWTGPEGSRRLRLPDFMTIGT
jgi:hypothetical protein